MIKVKRILVMLLIAALIVMTAGCTGQPAAPVESEASGESSTAPVVNAGGKDITIGWSMRALSGSPWFEAVIDAAKKTAEEMGVELIVIDAQNKPEKQVADIEDLIAKKVDIIVVNSIQPTSALNGIKAANDAGIPVIAEDSLTDPSTVKLESYVRVDNYEIAYGVGRALAEAWNKPEVKMSIVSGTAGDYEGFLRRCGMISGMSEYMYEKFGAADIQVLAQRYAGDWDANNALSQMQDILVSFPNNIDIAFCEWDSGAISCLKALQAVNHNALIGSIDGQLEALDLIKSGDFVAVGVNSATGLGRTTIEFCIKYMNGEKLPAEHIVEPIVVTKDNIDEHYVEGQPFI